MMNASNTNLSDLPDGFEVRDDGIFMLPEADNINGAPMWLCGPIRVEAVTHDLGNQRWGRKLVATDALGNSHTWIMSAVEISDFKLVFKELLHRGIEVSRDRSAQKVLSTFLLDWKPAKATLLTEKVGWADASFRTFILRDGTALGQMEAIYAPRQSLFQPRPIIQNGTPSDWTKEVAQRAENNPVLVVAISLAFSGPLLRIMGRDGFGLHFKGQSSTGKTTALHVATSVWGGRSLIQTCRTTANALEGAAVSADDSFLALDELGEISAKDASLAAYMLANGQGKGRATSRGAAATLPEWRMVFLSTGEVSIAEKLGEAGITPMGGQIVRVMDITVDGRNHGIFDDLHGEPCAADFSNRLKKCCANTCGTAGSAFVEKLIASTADQHKNREKVLERIKDHLLKSEGGPQTELSIRVATQFALIALAGEMATKCGLTGWSAGTAMQAAAELFKQWKIGQLDPYSQDEIVRRLKGFVSSEAARLQWVGGSHVPDQVGWQDAIRMMFDDQGWAEIHEGLDLKAVARAARGYGILTGTDGSNLKSKAPIAIPGRPRLYVVNKSILGS
ncbi:DUF927 domain-containing protein [Loktanella sp. R86503]|uniref:DUF927 domain-containing protein n=1 Tax=Loktanella sp. R86503 TaxID=3093847 RepID=UPI0036DB79D2